MLKRKKEGHQLTKTPEMIALEKEFSKLSLEDHTQKLRGLGLDEESLKEFKEQFNDKKDNKDPNN